MGQIDIVSYSLRIFTGFNSIGFNSIGLGLRGMWGPAPFLRMNWFCFRADHIVRE